MAWENVRGFDVASGGIACLILLVGGKKYGSSQPHFHIRVVGVLSQ